MDSGLKPGWCESQLDCQHKLFWFIILILDSFFSLIVRFYDFPILYPNSQKTYFLRLIFVDYSSATYL